MELAPSARARFIAEDPQQLTDLEELFSLRQVFEWDLMANDEAGAWSIERGRLQDRMPGHGLAVLADDSVVRLEREVTLEAAQVSVVELDVRGFNRGRARLFWTVEGDLAERAGSIEAGPAGSVGSGPKLVFDVGSDCGWRGIVTGLGLEFTVVKGDELDVRRLTGRRRGLSRAAIKRAAGSAWKIDLDHEARNVLLAVPGRPVERRLLVEPMSRLRLAYRSPRGVGSPLAFRVVATTDGGSSEALLEDRVAPCSAASGVWHEAEVDLSELAGKAVRLSLQTVADPLYDPGRDLAFWANPEVVRPGASHAPPGVVLISIDALRADHLSLYGYPLPTSPNLEEWAEEAVTFRNVVAPAPWTLPSHISMFTGLDCVRHGFNHDVGGVRNELGREPISDLRTLAELLRAEGYATAAITGGAYLHPRYGFSQGFDEYAYWPDRARDLDELATGVERALSWVERRREEPFLLFLHTYEVHDPYRARQPHFDALAPEGVVAPPGTVALRSPRNRPEAGFMQHNELVLRNPGEAERLLSADEIGLARAMYDSGVAYMDEQFGRLVEGLQRLGVADRTVIVFTADHGEALGEGGLAGHIYLTDSNLMIPLVMRLPGGRDAGRTVEDQVRLIDLFPTVVDALGLPEETGVDGVSLLPLADGEGSPAPRLAWSYSAAANRGLSLRVDNRVKFVLNNTAWPPACGAMSLFDLVRDEREEHDLATSSPLLGELREQARSYLEERAPGLRLRIANGSAGRLRGELTGQMIRPVGTKSPDLTEPWLRWGGPGRATFDVPAGGEFTIFFEKVFGSRLGLAGALELDGGTVPFDHTFSARGLRAAATLALDGERFAVGVGSPGELEVGFELWWHGAATLQTESPAEVDAQLRRQLEALGYVD